jgi:hypothetical protein
MATAIAIDSLIKSNSAISFEIISSTSSLARLGAETATGATETTGGVTRSLVFLKTAKACA